jgi:acyl-CoA synthetase (AMP-forming)/AMP-acid ligase II
MYRSSLSKKWYVVDRKKELIKVRGFQVSPAEIEGVLLAHPGVGDAAVIGIKDDHDSTVESPRAYVVKREGYAALSKEELTSFCAQRLAKYKALTGGISFVDAIPRSTAGKALKRILRGTAQRRDGSQEQSGDLMYRFWEDSVEN